MRVSWWRSSPRAKTQHVEVRRAPDRPGRLRDDERERARRRRCRSGPSRSPGAVPDLDHPVGDRLAGSVEQAARRARARRGRPGRRARSSRRGRGRSRRTARRSATASCRGSSAPPRTASRRRAAAEDDVPPVAERPLGRRGRRRSKRAISSSRAVGSRIEWKIGSYGEQRVAGEVHLRHEPLRRSAGRRARSGCAPAATRSRGCPTGTRRA